MPAPPVVYAFGPFVLDTASCRLLRAGEPVDLSPRLVDLLAYLVARPGELLAKETLLAASWPDVFVTENALARAISDVRRALDDAAAQPAFIQTVARRGYRFVARVEKSPRIEGAHPAPAPASPDPLEPYLAWPQGRLHLEALNAADLPAAVASFGRAAGLAPGDALARAGLANARFLQYETTRAHNAPERALLERAVADARAACSVDPSLGEAWATLGFLLVRPGAQTRRWRPHGAP